MHGTIGPHDAKLQCEVAHPCIDVGSVEAEEGPVYYVRDNGAGFDMRRAEKLFHHFENGQADDLDEAGIGLAVVQRVVDRHGGRIWAEGRVGDGATSRPDVEEPIYYWVPSIAPSGMMFYTGDMFPEWKGNLFIGAMAGQHLVRLVLNGERVAAEEQLLAEQKQRVREVRQAPDGSIYILQGASIVRLTPKK